MSVYSWLSIGRRSPELHHFKEESHNSQPFQTSIGMFDPCFLLVFFYVADLRKQMESSELRNQRLKEVFQKKIQEFRTVCYVLTGYQMDITTENQYRLTSVYAEHMDDSLLFKKVCICIYAITGTTFQPERAMKHSSPAVLTCTLAEFSCGCSLH